MNHRTEYLIRMEEANQAAASTNNPRLKAAWQKMADEWADLARQTGHLPHSRLGENGANDRARH
ncbi:MAG: hypothetical protein ACXU8S_01185 [Phenylobacterium sp.]